METVEIVVYVLIAVIIGGLVIAFVARFDANRTYESVGGLFGDVDPTQYEAVNSSHLARAALDLWEECGMGARNLNKTVYVTDEGDYSKADLFAQVKSYDRCDYLHSTVYACGEGDDVLFGSGGSDRFLIPNVVQMECTNETHQLVFHAAFAEVCNGVDDDNDGLIDEDWPELGQTCDEGVGACIDFGIWVCTADEFGVECDAEPDEPSLEVCDGLDDDCDGLPDANSTCVDICAAEICDGLDNDCDDLIDGDDAACTDCGQSCEINHAEGMDTCLIGAWGNCVQNDPLVCVGTWNDCNNDVQDGCEYDGECPLPPCGHFVWETTDFSTVDDAGLRNIIPGDNEVYVEVKVNNNNQLWRVDSSGTVTKRKSIPDVYQHDLYFVDNKVYLNGYSDRKVYVYDENLNELNSADWPYQTFRLMRPPSPVNQLVGYGFYSNWQTGEEKHLFVTLDPTTLAETGSYEFDQTTETQGWYGFIPVGSRADGSALLYGVHQHYYAGGGAYDEEERIIKFTPPSTVDTVLNVNHDDYTNYANWGPFSNDDYFQIRFKDESTGNFESRVYTWDGVLVFTDKPIAQFNYAYQFDVANPSIIHKRVRSYYHSRYLHFYRLDSNLNEELVLDYEIPSAYSQDVHAAGLNALYLGQSFADGDHVLRKYECVS